jgi:cell division protein ZapA
MPQVTVEIAGKTYRMACGDGEEQHLEGLAALFDGKIEEMRKSFGEIGDMRLHVMAALTLADDLGEAQRRVEALEREVEALKAAAATGEQRTTGFEARLAEALVKAAERVERLARNLNPAAAAPQ